MRRLLPLILAAGLALPQFATAQDTETLADIRQQLSALFTEVEGLRSELQTTGATGVDLSGTSALERVDAMEAELRRLTSLTEELEFRINRVVADGTNRVGDLEFRLCELEESCDIGSLGETPTLGGDSGAAPPPRIAPAPRPATGGGGAELAVGEQAAFDAAQQALDAGNTQEAADLFQQFAQTYTSGPLTTRAHYQRAQALQQLGNQAEAARAYLEAFSGAPQGPIAPDALLNLGVMLNELGQREDACATLNEVTVRFPDSPASIAAQTSRGSIGCG
ncbi:tol-pal system protein YbgF [Palleronia pelagia]|uniref:Cell division coordinator CpoB n=1 Tax=Palleronia pelagia TaxID=387096 RepID=A0A1H8JBU8_9RHOB|nr:tol-pal system protein YbgF [Palleronia pelagia]SEN78264.1 tol-pal system protein YbgF [Palleronia pelagia]